MKRSVFLRASLCLVLGAGIVRQTPAVSGTKTPDPADMIRIAFYYDANLNGIRDAGETVLKDLDVSSPGFFLRGTDGSVQVQKNKPIALHVAGKSPAGKPLTNLTHREPAAVTMLPNFTCTAGDGDMNIGLSDGWFTSPLRRHDMMHEDYSAVLKDPAAWKIQSDRLYPNGWGYQGNYFFYGYRIPEGGLAGTPHLAFDLWAKPGTPVLAGVPGTIVAPLYDWRFGIRGEYGTVYYNHIVPSVRIGDRVKRYDVVGYIAEGQGNHVHVELRPDPERILEAFPGVGDAHFLKSPLRGEPVPRIPFFGR